MMGSVEGAQHVPSVLRTLRAEPPRNVVIANIADRQHGAISLPQLKTVGLTASAVRTRVADGQLHRIHRGVYAVGHRGLTEKGAWMAAILACGPKAVLSHRSAAALWGLRPDARATTDISLPSRSVRARRGIRVHAASSLAEREITARSGIPCTTVARTLVDLAVELDRRGVERAVEQAEVLGLFDGKQVREAAGKPGAGVLRSVLEEWAEPAMTASELEERFLTLCREAEVEAPEVNRWVLLEGAP